MLNRSKQKLWHNLVMRSQTDWMKLGWNAPSCHHWCPVRPQVSSPCQKHPSSWSHLAKSGWEAAQSNNMKGTWEQINHMYVYIIYNYIYINHMKYPPPPVEGWWLVMPLCPRSLFPHPHLLPKPAKSANLNQLRGEGPFPFQMDS